MVQVFSKAPMAELLDINGVNIGAQDLEAIHTTDNLMLLLAPNDINPTSATDCLQSILTSAEKEMIKTQKGDTCCHPDIDMRWEYIEFPKIIGQCKYPRGAGNFAPLKKGQRIDTSYKEAIHFEFETRHQTRVQLVVSYCKQKKYHKQYFGEFATLSYIPGKEASTSEMARYKTLLSHHHQCTQAFNVMLIPGLESIKRKVFVTSQRNDGTESQVLMLDVIRHMTIRMADGKKRRAIQCCFPANEGMYGIFYPGVLDAFRKMAKEFTHNAAAYTYHQCMRWNWSKEDAGKLVEHSFNLAAIRTVKHSKWDPNFDG
jgi:hypothetical protein